VQKACLLKSKFVFVNVLVLFVVTGCSSRQLKPTETGFLSSYSDLNEDEELEGMSVYKNPNVDIAERYASVLIAPVQFKLNPNPEEHGMKEEDKEKLASHFYEELKNRLTENYEITDVPGEHVLLIRTAITDILPNKVYLNLHWSTTLMGAGTGGASLEAEAVDSLTGERIMAIVDARKGKRLHYTKGLSKWGHTKAVLANWANIMAINLNQMREGSLSRQ